MSVAPQFDTLARELLPPGTVWWHIADEMLANVAFERGGLKPFLYRRVADHALAAREAGADVLQLTCSSISPCADPGRWLSPIPILKVDESMVRQAVRTATRIGIAATATTALAPLTDQVRACAQAIGRSVEVDAVLCEGAYAHLISGNLPEHDRIIRSNLAAMAGRNDVILLAQASMARVVDAMPPASRLVPLLTSPTLAVQQLRDVLAGQ
ncbi:MAG: Asp/Glu/hydantoin racemase [Opitutus sp.]|nr:Asp/Glu/hydantoin racemase [Opitutus sp.]